MSSAKRLIIASLAIAAMATSAWAGGGSATNDDQNDPWIALSVKVHHPRKTWAPAVGVARATETFLHWPRILAEALYGERPLVSKKGILALRETPMRGWPRWPGRMVDSSGNNGSPMRRGGSMSSRKLDR